MGASKGQSEGFSNFWSKRNVTVKITVPLFSTCLSLAYCYFIGKEVFNRNIKDWEVSDLLTY